MVLTSGTPDAAAREQSLAPGPPGPGGQQNIRGPRRQAAAEHSIHIFVDLSAPGRGRESVWTRLRYGLGAAHQSRNSRTDNDSPAFHRLPTRVAPVQGFAVWRLVRVELGAARQTRNATGLSAWKTTRSRRCAEATRVAGWPQARGFAVWRIGPPCLDSMTRKPYRSLAWSRAAFGRTRSESAGCGLSTRTRCCNPVHRAGRGPEA